MSSRGLLGRVSPVVPKADSVAVTAKMAGSGEGRGAVCPLLYHSILSRHCTCRPACHHRLSEEPVTSLSEPFPSLSEGLHFWMNHGPDVALEEASVMHSCCQARPHAKHLKHKPQRASLPSQ